eukprot:CAMPEP_0178528800 /NCGR_PEP_ID=MMETSP0696-20121128/31995_1 /TAXON_ID=265572 /ORGANISM="Extubocellulus spinifer, Strain CCMP396" /LENGTH=70 /DNA_ID=CAMNT_0020160477 /DNA_START=466 /DNA_END=678 /DNA_ORIENTATION=+
MKGMDDPMKGVDDPMMGVDDPKKGMDLPMMGMDLPMKDMIQRHCIPQLVPSHPLIPSLCPTCSCLNRNSK